MNEYKSKPFERYYSIYRNYVKEFGARQEENKYYTDEILDFAKANNFKLPRGVIFGVIAIGVRNQLNKLKRLRKR